MVKLVLPKKQSNLPQMKVRLPRIYSSPIDAHANLVFPIVCEPTSDKWHHLIPSLDVVVEAIGGHIPENAIKIFNATTEAAKSLRPAGAPKLTFIFTSGTWVHGENGRELVSDTTPIVKSVEIATWRASFEQDIVNGDILNGIVIRPSMVYGRSGSLFGMLFDRVRKAGKVTYPGKPGDRIPTIHQDDLADVYVRAAEKALLIGGLIIDASNNMTESTDALLQRLVEVTGIAGPYEFTEPKDRKHRFKLHSRSLLTMVHSA